MSKEKLFNGGTRPIVISTVCVSRRRHDVNAYSNTSGMYGSKQG